MNTKEDLIVGLQNAIHLMKTMVRLQGERSNIQSRYSRHIMLSQPWAGKKLKKRSLLIILGITLVLSQTLVWVYVTAIFMAIFNNMAIAQFLTFITILGAGVIIVPVIVKVVNKFIANKNEKISEQNAEIDKLNQPLIQAETEIIQQMKAVQERYASEVFPWYPSDYCKINAADFFLNSIQNFRADNMKEAINLYEDTLHKRSMEHAQQQMLVNQDAMIRQQKLNNMLTIGTMVMQAGIRNSIDNNTKAVNNVNATLRKPVDISIRRK